MRTALFHRSHDVFHGLVGSGRESGERAAGRLLRRPAVLGVARSELHTEELLEYEPEIDVAGQAVALVERERHAVPSVDLGEEPRIGRVDDEPAEHAGELAHGVE